MCPTNSTFAPLSVYLAYPYSIFGVYQVQRLYNAELTGITDMKHPHMCPHNSIFATPNSMCGVYQVRHPYMWLPSSIFASLTVY